MAGAGGWDCRRHSWWPSFLVRHSLFVHSSDLKEEKSLLIPPSLPVHRGEVTSAVKQRPRRPAWPGHQPFLLDGLNNLTHALLHRAVPAVARPHVQVCPSYGTVLDPTGRCPSHVGRFSWSQANSRKARPGGTLLASTHPPCLTLILP